jgi:hypothetical protein
MSTQRELLFGAIFVAIVHELMRIPLARCAIKCRRRDSDLVSPPNGSSPGDEKHVVSYGK